MSSVQQKLKDEKDKLEQKNRIPTWAIITISVVVCVIVVSLVGFLIYYFTKDRNGSQSSNSVDNSKIVRRNLDTTMIGDKHLASRMAAKGIETFVDSNGVRWDVYRFKDGEIIYRAVVCNRGECAQRLQKNPDDGTWENVTHGARTLDILHRGRNPKPTPDVGQIDSQDIDTVVWKDSEQMDEELFDTDTVILKDT